MDIKKIEVGKEYYIINNNGYVSTFACLSNDGVVIRIRIHPKEGFGGGRTSELNTIECERYVVKKN